MKKITTPEVIAALEGIISNGRDTPVKIDPLNSPASVLKRMGPDDVARLDPLGLYKGISANSYEARASMLWTSLFWKIGEQILIVNNYTSEFQRFYTELNVGADIEEVAPRIKEGLDRQTLSNSALLANYVTQWDSFYHRINQFKVWATTYDRYEIERISQSWDNITNMLNGELQNIILSASDYIHTLSKEALASQYWAGGMDAITLPTITDSTTAQQNAIGINTAIDAMTIEINGNYIPYNRNSLNPDPTIRDIASSELCLVATAELLNNVMFLTALDTYFGKEWRSDRFAGNVIKVMDFPTGVSPNIAITPGYTPVTGSPKLQGILIERNALIFKQKLIGTFNFDNALTLKTSNFHHLDAMANVSDRRKSVALVW